jgi:hypothetical protein
LIRLDPDAGIAGIADGETVNCWHNFSARFIVCTITTATMIAASSRYSKLYLFIAHGAKAHPCAG